MTVDLSKFPLPCFVKLRNGTKAWVFGKSPFGEAYIGCIDGENSDGWSVDARYEEHDESPYDIIAEWKEPRSVEYVAYDNGNGNVEFMSAKSYDNPKHRPFSWTEIGRGVWKEGE
jgi:hypothetical protein